MDLRLGRTFFALKNALLAWIKKKEMPIMSETMIIVVFFISLGILLFGIMKLKMDSGVMMLITSLITGIILMMPAKVLVGTVA